MKSKKELKIKLKEQTLKDETRLEKQRTKEIKLFLRKKQALLRIEQAEKQKQFLKQLKLDKQIEKFRIREIKELDEQGQNWNENDLHSVQGRICKPEEVASAVLYLASDDSSFVNGTALYVDNGWYAKG